MRIIVMHKALMSNALRMYHSAIYSELKAYTLTSVDALILRYSENKIIRP